MHTMFISNTTNVITCVYEIHKEDKVYKKIGLYVATGLLFIFPVSDRTRRSTVVTMLQDPPTAPIQSPPWCLSLCIYTL